MPAQSFICPDGQEVTMDDCLKTCRLSQRCMLLPTLRAIAKSTNRNIQGFTVTELIGGLRETYLKKVTNYAVDPQKRAYAIHGSAAHLINHGHIQGEILGEERLFGATCSGQFDLYGAILDDTSATLGDIKITSSYKLMKALGWYKVDVPTGELYKSGLKIGQAKTVKSWRSDGVKHLFDWAVQLNYYRILLEEHGFPVNKMVIQGLSRDSGLRIAAERHIEQPVYLIEINKISDRWVKQYVQAKAKRLQEAVDTNTIPAVCSARERWHDRKCQGYCEVAGACSHARSLRAKKSEVA